MTEPRNKGGGVPHNDLPPPMDAPSIDRAAIEYLAQAREWADGAIPTPQEIDALRRLVAIAKSDTGQSRRVAEFLLAWWNAGQCGGFDMTNLWSVDVPIARDMLVVFGMIARCSSYPDRLVAGIGSEFEEIVRQWRPEVFGSSTDGKQ